VFGSFQKKVLTVCEMKPLSLQAKTILFGVFTLLAAGLLGYYIYVAWTANVDAARTILLVSTILVGLTAATLLFFTAKNGFEWSAEKKKEAEQSQQPQSFQ
jgi:hypothetical protein